MFTREFIVHYSAVPCYKRCKEIEYTEEHEKVIEPDDPEGGWVDTHHFANLNEKVQEMSIGEKRSITKHVATPSKIAGDEEEDEEDEGGDMEDFIESGLIDDDQVS